MKTFLAVLTLVAFLSPNAFAHGLPTANEIALAKSAIRLAEGELKYARETSGSRLTEIEISVVQRVIEDVLSGRGQFIEAQCESSPRPGGLDSCHINLVGEEGAYGTGGTTVQFDLILQAGKIVAIKQVSIQG